MIPLFERTLQIITVLGCVSSSLYYLLCLWSAASFLRERNAIRNTEGKIPAQQLPHVSILKPLKGIDPQIYQSFRSHCLQDYSEYEIIFGVSDTNDPAVASVNQLQREFPNREIRLVVCEKILGTNVKLSNLVQMLPSARYEYLIVNDSDIQVERDYLRRIMQPFADEPSSSARVGVVTCLYRGVPEQTFGSRIESLGISTDFCAGVLVARQIEGGLHFGLGSTLAFRRSDLERAGGFEAIVDYLADDYELGRRIADLGRRVELPDVVVETHLPAYSLTEFLSHQMRWARGVRDARLGGYVGLIFTFGFAWSLLNLVVAHAAPWAWAVLIGIAALRLAVALVVGKTVLQQRELLRHLWLLPLRDLIAVLVWIVSFSGHTVMWRGDRFELKNGRLNRVTS
jgi:ceramide glucosyltransferase